MTNTDIAQRTRVLIVDDNPRFREGVRAVLGVSPGCECVGTLGSADELVAAIVKLRPDVVLLDLDMPGRNVIEAIVEIRRYRGHDTAIVILSGIAQRWAVETALAVGARGYVLKFDGPEAIHAAIDEVARGGTALSPTAAMLLPEGYSPAADRARASHISEAHA